MQEFEQLKPADLRRALEYTLAAPGGTRAAARGQIAGFLDYLALCPVEWEGLRCGPRAAPRGLFVALLLPGRTVIIMLPNPGELGIAADEQIAITQAGLATLAHRELHYAQVLLEPEAVAKRGLVERVGFQALAPLAYLERDVAFPWVDPPPTEAANWVSYDQVAPAEFGDVVLATYEESHDCPELTGLRPIDDILAAHQASGPFDASLWELVQVDGAMAGCLLLSRVVRASLLEIVYMGVLPAWRGRGIGGLILRRALQQSRTFGARRLTVVVDERNTAARRLYESFALVPAGRRHAYFYRWPSPLARSGGTPSGTGGG